MSSVIQFDIWAAIKLQKHQLPIVNKILLAITRSANGGLIWILTGLGVLAGFREKHLGILNMNSLNLHLNRKRCQPAKI